MKKLILFILFCAVWISQSFASIPSWIYGYSWGTIDFNVASGSISQYNSSWALIRKLTPGSLWDFKTIFLWDFSKSGWTCSSNSTSSCYILGRNNNGRLYSVTTYYSSVWSWFDWVQNYGTNYLNTTSYSRVIDAYWDVHYGARANNWLILHMSSYDSSIINHTYSLTWSLINYWTWDLYYKGEKLSIYNPLLCNNIQQSTPVYTSIINIWSIEDITWTGADTTYQIWTWSYVRFFNISDLVGVDDLFYSSWSMTLKSSNAIFWEKPSIYIGSLSWLDSINISSDLWLVNIYWYNQSGELIFDLQKQSLSSTVFFPSKATYIILEFWKSFFTYTINSIDIRGKSIGIITKELCLDTETQEYTLDGEPYTQTSTGSLDTPTAPPSSEWSYTVSWYNFFENWFCLANFVPNPYGGKLRFEIVTPAWDNQTTQDFWPYETDGFWYGFDSCVKVTTFFHENAWIYKVRVLYEYNGETVFPFGSDYNSYTISLPEVRANIGIDGVDNWSACWTDTWTFAWITNFFDCLNKTVSRFFSSVYKNIQKIGDFITHMTNIFTTEVKTFSFIENSYAFWEDFYVKPAWYDALIFWKITNIFNLIVALCGIILSIWVIVFIKNNKND